jgi:Oligosaccharide biosynthesis protein Alg14 like
VFLISSNGGVLLDVMALAPWWERHTVRWVSVAAEDTRGVLAGYDVAWCAELRPALRISFAVEAARAVHFAWRELHRQPCALIVSAGSGVAIPWFVAAWIVRVPRVWVETFNVRGRPGLAARLCARLASVVVVQHPELMAKHRRALYVGELY